MAAVTAAVVTAGAAAASAGASMKAASEQSKARRDRNRAIKKGALRDFGFGTAGGDGPFGSFNAETGAFETGLGSRLEGQLGMVDSLAAAFGANAGADFTGDMRNTIGLQQMTAGQQADPNSNLFANLAGRAQSGLNMAQAGLGRAAGIQGQLDPFAQQAFGLAQQQFGDIGTAEQVRGDVLGLLRQQAAPFEERAFSGLQDKQFATGRLGSSGGALQTEAFARGLAQADTDRQLRSFAEGRNVQQNALGLAQGLSGIGSGALNLGDNLMGNAFRNFGAMSGLAQDIDRQRFGQETSVQQNLFNQLGSIFGNQARTAGLQDQLQTSNFSNFLRALGAGQAINQIPLDRLKFAQDVEAQRQNAAIGVGSNLGTAGAGSGWDSAAAAFSGLAGAAQNFGSIFQNIGQPASTTAPSAYTPTAQQAFGSSYQQAPSWFTIGSTPGGG